MQVFSSLINWLFPTLPSEQEVLYAMTQAKLHEVKHLIIRQKELNHNYYPYHNEHPTLLAEKISEFVKLYTYSPFYPEFCFKNGVSLDNFSSYKKADCIKNFLHQPIKGKSLLGHLEKDITSLPLPFTQAIPSNNPFFFTDLIVFDDTYKGPLPTNGILKTDFEKLTMFYDELILENSPLKISGTIQFKLEVMKAIKILLTRPTGRKLLYFIFKPHFFDYLKNLILFRYVDYEVKCLAAPIASYANMTTSEEDKTRFEIHLSFNKQSEVFLESKDGQINQTEKSPFFITLAHELIHIRHFIMRKKWTANKIQELNLYSNEYEKVAITGILNDQTQDDISENSIRSEFGLIPRIYHAAKQYL